MAHTECRHDGPRGGERQCQHEQHAKQHEQEIPQPQRAAVLLFGALKVAGGGKVNAPRDVAAQQVQQQGYGGGSAEQ